VASIGTPYWIRIPLISEVNATEDNIQAMIAFLCSLPSRPQVVDLLPYHDIGKGKHERMGTTYNPSGLSLSAPTPEGLTHVQALLEAAGLPVRIGG